VLAYNIILVPFNRLASPLHEVLYPVFSRLQDDLARLASAWLRAVRILAAVAVPSMLGLIVVAPDIVPLVFGRRWSDAVPVVQVLAWVGILLALQGLNSVVLQAIGRTRLLVRYAAAACALGAVSFVVGLPWGIVGVASSFAVASTVTHLAYMALTARAVGTTFTAYLSAVGGVLQASVLAAALAGAVRALLAGAGVPVGARLAAAALVGLAAFAAACAWRAPAVGRELAQLRRRARAAEPAPQAA
jgi:PST family polysaccharide transporter